MGEEQNNGKIRTECERNSLISLKKPKKKRKKTKN